jgi:Ca2+-binding RTX toxin-like protein
VIDGLGGADTISGRQGNDRLCGGAGDDVLNGRARSRLDQRRPGLRRLPGRRAPRSSRAASASVVSGGGRTAVVIQGTTSADYASGKTAIDGVLATVRWEP